MPVSHTEPVESDPSPPLLYQVVMAEMLTRYAVDDLIPLPDSLLLIGAMVRDMLNGVSCARRNLSDGYVIPAAWFEELRSDVGILIGAVQSVMPAPLLDSPLGLSDTVVPLSALQPSADASYMTYALGQFCLRLHHVRDAADDERCFLLDGGLTAASWFTLTEEIFAGLYGVVEFLRHLLQPESVPPPPLPVESWRDEQDTRQ